jgi:hypothetical protein
MLTFVETYPIVRGNRGNRGVLVQSSFEAQFEFRSSQSWLVWDMQDFGEGL